MRSDWLRGVFAWEYVNMVSMSRCFAVRVVIMPAQIWKSFWVENSTSLLYLLKFFVWWNLENNIQQVSKIKTLPHGRICLDSETGLPQDFPLWQSFVDQAYLVMIAGYWPCCCCLFLFCFFVDLNFISVHKKPTKNLTKSQPSWPRAWSITHLYSTRVILW